MPLTPGWKLRQQTVTTHKRGFLLQDTTPAALGVRSGVRDAPHYDLCKLPLCILRCCCSAFYTSLASNALDTEVQRVHQDCGMWLPAPPKPVCAHGSVYGAFLGVVRRYIFFAGLGFRLVESLSWATCLHQRLATVGGPHSIAFCTLGYILRGI